MAQQETRANHRGKGDSDVTTALVPRGIVRTRAKRRMLGSVKEERKKGDSFGGLMI